MEFVLINCKDKLHSLGIDVSTNGWQDNLTAKLKSYGSFDGWGYDYSSDTLVLTPTHGASISTNLTDFGDAGGIQL